MLWALGVAGTVFCAYIIVQLMRYRDSANWPTTDATVETIAVRRKQDNGHHFIPLVSFSFTVANECYSGEWFGPGFSTEQEAKEFVQKNTPVAANLKVRFKPSDPKLNLLDIDPSLWDKGRPITLGL
jgi:Protein of unknown function (DUF3592)